MSRIRAHTGIPTNSYCDTSTSAFSLHYNTRDFGRLVRKPQGSGTPWGTVIRQQQLHQPKPHLPPSFFELPWYALQILWTVSLVLTRANIQRHHDGNVASNNRHEARTSPRVTTHPTLARSRPVSPCILVACETQPLGLMRPA
jgi:hypothetical protein